MTHYHYGIRGSTYYAKPEPLVASPWADDAVSGTENGTTGSFAFTLPTGNYAIYQQLGGSPADSDPLVGWFDALDPGIYPHVKGQSTRQVIWTWVKNSQEVATVSPTIDIMSRAGVSLIGGAKAATINPRNVQHTYEHGTPVFSPRNQYWLVLTATIDGISFTRDIPLST